MTWEDYKENVKAEDEMAKKEIEEAEERAYIVSALIKKRNELGISQRELASVRYAAIISGKDRVLQNLTQS